MTEAKPAPTGWKAQVGTILIGKGVKEIEEWLFDTFLYGAVSLWASTTYGIVPGALITFLLMAPSSAVICLVYLLGYDWSQKDWLGLEARKLLREQEVTARGLPGLLQKMGRWILRRSDPIAMLWFSITGDPFTATAYLRKGAYRYDGLSGRDWQNFYTSVLVSNGYWTFRWAVLVEGARWLFTKLPITWQESLTTTWHSLPWP